MKLTLQHLQRLCHPEEIPFDSTDQIDTNLFTTKQSQARALDALVFGVGIKHVGFNMVAVGPNGIGKQTLIRQYLQEISSTHPEPSDWCYVHNFRNPQSPRILKLPAGTGAQIENDMHHSIAEFRSEIRSVFEAKEYLTKKHQLIENLKKRQQAALDFEEKKASKLDVTIIQTEDGFGVAPMVDGQPADSEKFQSLSSSDQNRLRQNLEIVSNDLQVLLRSFNDLRREHANNLKALQRETAATVARRIIDNVRLKYRKNKDLCDHLNAIEIDIVDNIDDLFEDGNPTIDTTIRKALHQTYPNRPSFSRYQINTIVDRSSQKGTPIVFEDHPTHPNLIGMVEHESHFGSLVTNFLLIRPGSLHKALDGYLIIDAIKLLQQPFAWDALKRTIKSGLIHIESLGQAIGLVTTIAIDPEPIPLGNTKIILLSDRILYFLMANLDAEFVDLFKVLIDFDDFVDRAAQNIDLYSKIIASITKAENTNPFDRTAIASIIDQAARIAEDQDKLSLHMRSITDLIRESDYSCSKDGRTVVTSDDVQNAIESQRNRYARIYDKLIESIIRGDLLISVDGWCVGQINGISVFQIGTQTFGYPMRITARTRIGKGDFVDIEREVKLGGPIHSKGVMILTGFIASHYAATIPLSLSATIVFEQSYSNIEGDSASLAELCVILSSLANTTINQSIAVTGSLNQHGEVQSVGRINEKIEGYFDLCQNQKLTGRQGVIIPHSNIKNLMLRDNVCKAVEDGTFSIYAVTTVDDAIEILTELPAGLRDNSGFFQAGTFNEKVERRLLELAKITQQFSSRSEIINI